MESLLKKARECGFDACGVVPVDVLSREREAVGAMDRTRISCGNELHGE